MADIFISYAREDRERCVEIRDALEALKLSVWFDAELLSGAGFRAEIDRELAAARAVLVLWSRESVKSPFVCDEVDVASGRLILAAAFIEDCKPPLGHGGTQGERLMPGAAGTLDPAWNGILRRVEDLTGRKGLRDYTRVRTAPSMDGWIRWISANAGDPLVATALRGAISSETERMRVELADERVRRTQFEESLKDEQATATALARELSRVRKELAVEKRAHDDTKHALEDVEAEGARRGGAADRSGQDAEIARLHAMLSEQATAKGELERQLAVEVDARVGGDRDVEIARLEAAMEAHRKQREEAERRAEAAEQQAAEVQREQSEEVARLETALKAEQARALAAERLIEQTPQGAPALSAEDPDAPLWRKNWVAAGAATPPVSPDATKPKLTFILGVMIGIPAVLLIIISILNATAKPDYSYVPTEAVPESGPTAAMGGAMTPSNSSYSATGNAM